MNIYQVVDWEDHFENTKSKKYNQCSHAYVPNKQHGMGFTYILSQPEGAAIIGIWYLIVEALSMQRLPRKGYCTDTGGASGRPWTAETLALRWRRPVVEISRALDVLSSQDVGWLRVVKHKDTVVPPEGHCDAHSTLTPTPTPTPTPRAALGGGQVSVPTPPESDYSNALKKIRECAVFKSVSDDAIVAVLHKHEHQRPYWIARISDMVLHSDGANVGMPIRLLDRYLEGRKQDQPSRVPVKGRFD